MTKRKLLKAILDMDKDKKESFFYLLYLGMTPYKSLNWISDQVGDIITWFRVRKERVERFFFWGWKLRKNHDWDAVFIYDILDLKLKRMIKCFKEYGNCAWNQDSDYYNYIYMEKLERASFLVNKLSNFSDFQYLEDLECEHDRKWGKLETIDIPCKEGGYTEMKFFRVNAVTKKEKNQEIKEYEALNSKRVEARENDKKEFFNLISEYIGVWWD